MSTAQLEVAERVPANLEEDLGDDITDAVDIASRIALLIVQMIKLFSKS